MEATRRRSPLRGNGRIALLLAIPVLVLLSFAAYGGDVAPAGIQYRISWIDLQLMYRYLYYDMKSDQALQNVSFYGPAFGLNFRF
jgi:hypothetical protein